jgi:zinc transport system permease protein
MSAGFFDILFEHSFMQHALLAGLLASIACGITGTFVVVKKITYVGGGISHAVLGGIGIAYFLRVNPIFGAIAFALVAAILIGIVKLRLKQNEDMLINTLWALGMAIGIIFMYLTPGYAVDLLSFLFGNILMVTRGDLLVLAVLDFAIILIVFFLYRQFVSVCFDDEYSAMRGIPADVVYILLLCLVALTVVILIQVVGLILVIALLTLPAAISLLFSKSPRMAISLAILLGICFTTLGLFFSHSLNIPSGAAIIVVACLGYLIALSVRSVARFRSSHFR